MSDPSQSGDVGQQLRDINEALLRSSVRQHELTGQAQNAEARLRESEARLQLALDAAKMGTFAWHVAEDRSVADARMLALFGLPPGGALTLRSALAMMIHPDDRERYAAAVARSVTPGARGELREEIRVLLLDGSQRWLSISGLTAFDRKTGQATEMAGVALDITDRKAAEEALHESEERFRSFAENSGDTLWIADAGTGELEYLSPAFERQWGESREAVMRDSGRWSELIHPEDRERATLALPRALAGETLAIEYRIVRPSDGRVSWMRDTGFPIRDEHGRVRRVAGIAQDITEHKHAVEHQRLLLAELQHRVRNTLAVVRSIARRTGETSESVEDYAMHLDGRLNSFARMQAVVTRNPAAGVDLEHMIAEELVSYHAHEGEQVRIGGPTVRLKSKAAETFALAVHELATNAVKYGALASAGGRIAVTWSLDASDGDARLRLEWRESGVGLDAAKLRRKGFGMELLERTLLYELAAKTTLDFRREGLICTIELPLTERIAVAASP